MDASLSKTALADAIHWVPASISLLAAVIFGAILARWLLHRLERVEERSEKSAERLPQFITRDEFVAAEREGHKNIYAKLDAIADDVAFIRGKLNIRKGRG